MMENPSSPLATMEDSVDSPIGRMSADWSVELSPIAHRRGSSESPIMNILSPPVITEREKKKTQSEVKEQQLPLQEKFMSEEENSGQSAPSVSRRTIFRNPYLTKNEDVEKPTKATDKRSWFLTSEESTTPPLSTSTEFSLESLSETEGISSKEGESDESPETESIARIPQKNGDHDYQPGQGNPQHATAENSINKDTESAEPVLHDLNIDEKTCSSHREDEPQFEKSHQTKLKTESSPKETHMEGTSNDGTQSRELDIMNLSAETSALYEDAALKVRSLIYEYSVLDSSNSPVNSSEDSTGRQSDSSMSETGHKKDKKRRSGPKDCSVSACTISQLDKATKEIPKHATEDALQSSTSSSHSSADLFYASDEGKTKSWHTPTKQRETSSSFHKASVNEGTPSRTPGKVDYTNAKKEVGATSFEFLQKLHGAAQRRKQKVVRSRDSLVAKEQASSQMASKPQTPGSATPKAQKHEKTPRRQKPTPSGSFKAKPLPATTGDMGSGGLSGVPKVAKKPATVPTSPRLGSRRSKQPTIKALGEPTTKPRFVERKAQPQKHSRPSYKVGGSFKARPAPPTTGALGRSGQSGVPKVPKRPVTVPSSPCLGQRRRHSSVATGKENGTEARRISTGMVKWTPSTCRAPPKSKASPMSMSSSSQATGGLLGLDLLSMKSSEPESPPLATPPSSACISAFEPRSTQRAKKRAEFEARRMVNEQLRMEEEIEDRENRVQRMKKELETLRDVI